MTRAFQGRASSPYSVLSHVLGLCLALTLAIGAPNAANAASGKEAAVVIDVNSGKTLYQSNADSRRYPASLTKMMTLYMAFEAMAKGKIGKNTSVPFSAHASSMPPTKLGVKPGNSITVETAILSMVTKSANDSAAAMAELLGGSESNFAKMMTARARQLGMSGTVFRNASGLPNSGQFTTARDMARLGIALRRDFPQYYDYFSRTSFTYGRTRIRGHNYLLGRIKGVDGIKTGYTRASGFNLVSSVATDNRKLVAVVMGGVSGRSRDNQMAGLIKKYLPQASTRRGEALVASAGPADNEVVLPRRNAPTPDTRPAAIDRFAHDVPTPPSRQVASSKAAEQVAAFAAPSPRPKVAVDMMNTASVPSSGGWAVQVGAAPTVAGAKEMLERSGRAVPEILADASAFTMEYQKGGTTLHRARFGGFSSKDAAWNACNALKRKHIACYAIQQ